MKHQSQGLFPSSSDFSEIRHSKAFADKTAFLYEWLTHRPKQWYVTAPPGFGKSTLGTMAVQFLNASVEIVNGVEMFHDKQKTAAYELFQGLEIFEMKEFVDKHFQNYAVVYLDLAPLSNTTEATFKIDEDFLSQDFHKYLKMVIRKMMSYYPTLHLHHNLTPVERATLEWYLGEMKTEVTPVKFWKSASTLARLLRKCFKKDVIVVVDSYDSLCKPNILGDLTKIAGPYVASYIINFSKMIIQDGQSRVLYLGTFKTIELMLQKPSDLRLQKKTMYTIEHTDFYSDERIAKYFGLSRREVTDILARYSMLDHFSVVDDLLDGHAVLKSPLTLFNTKAVLSYIENKNATPSAVTSPYTAEILSKYGKLFLNKWISDKTTQCIFKNKTEVMFPHTVMLNFANFARMKQLLNNNTLAVFKQTLMLDETLSFIHILQFLGLISTIDVRGDLSDFRVSSRSDAELMSGYLCNSGNVQEFFKVSAEDEIGMIRALKSIAPDNDSMQNLGEAVHKIVRVKAPEEEYQLKSLMDVYSRKVAIYNSEEFGIEAGVTVPGAEHLNVEKSGELGSRERIDIIFIKKKEGRGIILKSRLDISATSVLKEMIDNEYLKIFDSDPRFSKLNIKEKTLIGISVSQNKSVEIAAEVWHENERTSLKHVVLNN
nr:PREDICTED: uncharacterized protein LOC109040908 isoform X2 [Bemisia tabaci]